MKAPHTIEVKDIAEYLKDFNWHVFASSAGSVNKKLMIEIGGRSYKVLHKDTVVYHGYDVNDAVVEYNNITTAEPV